LRQLVLLLFAEWAEPVANRRGYPHWLGDQE